MRMVFAAAAAASALSGAAAECPGDFVQGQFCYKNAANVIKHVQHTTAADCCTLCSATEQCKSWTSWGNGTSRACNLFRTVAGRDSADTTCTSGYSKKALTNFIFVFPDTLRAESFNTYGLQVPGVTPNLDRFAATGTRFEQAHVMHTQCSPSRCTMLTGRYMHVSGHRTQTHLVQDYEPNYFRVLKESGYHVRLAGKNDAFSATAFNLSITEWSSGLGYPSGSNAFKFGESGYFSFLSTGSNESGADLQKCADYRHVYESVQWLHNSPPEPFLLFLPSRGAHPPYGAPKEWHSKFPVSLVKEHVTLRPRDITGMPSYMRSKDGIPHYRNLTWLGDDTLYRIQATYLGMIAYTDWIFGQLLDGLDATPGGLADRTAVFFSSDHGDFGGDYGLVEKWPGSMADVLTRVPLVGRIPGGAKGQVSKAPVQTADILETMLDLAGIEADFVRFGSSLRAQLQGGEGDLSRFVYSEGGFHFKNEQMVEANECLRQCPKGLYCPRGQEEAAPNGSPRAVMIRNLTAKLVHRPTGVSELYDLAKDPRETQNLYADSAHAQLREQLLSQLLDWMVLTSDVTPVYADSRGPPGYPHAIGPDPWADRSVWKGGPADYLAINGATE